MLPVRKYGTLRCPDFPLCIKRSDRTTNRQTKILILFDLMGDLGWSCKKLSFCAGVLVLAFMAFVFKLFVFN